MSGRIPRRIFVQFALAVPEGVDAHRGFLYLNGPTGAGKSLWLAAIVAELVAPLEAIDVDLDAATLVDRWQVPPRARPAHGRPWPGPVRAAPPGGAQWAPLVVDEQEVVRRVSLAWSQDQDPLAQMARASVLV